VKSNMGGKEYRDTQKRGSLSQAGDKWMFKRKISGNWRAVDRPCYRHRVPSTSIFYLSSVTPGKQENAAGPV